LAYECPRTGISTPRRPLGGRDFQEVSQPMAKNLTRAVAALVVTIGGIALTACNSCCNPCTGGPPVYRRPCCAGGGSYGAPAAAPMYAAPMQPAPMQPAPMAPMGGGKACGGNKCG